MRTYLLVSVLSVGLIGENACCGQSLTSVAGGASIGGWPTEPQAQIACLYTSGPHVWSPQTQVWVTGSANGEMIIPSIESLFSPLTNGLVFFDMALPASLEGQNISLAMSLEFIDGAFSCQCMGLGAYYFDFLQTQSFVVQTQMDCTTGTSSIFLLDNPADEGDLTVPGRVQNVSYTLRRNGVLVAGAGGALSGKHVANPPSFVFSGLVGGDHELELYRVGFPENGLLTDTEIKFRVVFPSAGDCSVNVIPKVCLLGGSGCLSSDALRANGLIPLTEPYSALGYSYTGAQSDNTIAPGVLSNTLGGFSPMDWAVVELRSATNPAQVVHSKPALIQRDGELMGPDGDMYVSFPVPAGNYHVAVRHRNHFGVMTLNPVALGTAPRVVDLTSTSATYGGGAMYPDVNGDGALRYIGTNNDRDPILTAIGGTTPNNTLGPVYDRRDVNMDGVIRYIGTNNDRDIILNNVGGTTPNNTRIQQLP